MATPFSLTTRSLRDDRHSGTGPTAVIALALLAAWLVWGWRGRLTLYESSHQARLEVVRQTHPLETEVAGRVATVHLRVGESVKLGQALLSLDGAPVEAARERAREEIAALRRQRAALTQELAAEQEAAESTARAMEARLAETEAALAEAEELVSIQKDVLSRYETLHEAGLYAEIPLLEARQAAVQAHARVTRLRQNFDQQNMELKALLREREARRRNGLRREMETEERVAAVTARLAQLDLEIERHVVRATCDGVLGEAAPIQPGTYLASGTRIGVVLPEGGFRVRALFDPAAVFGRIEPGQTARVRLMGFPLATLTGLGARVEQVSREPRDGTVQILLTLDPAGNTPPLTHGQPCAVEVAVGRVAPLTYCLRTLSKTWLPPDPI